MYFGDAADGGDLLELRRLSSGGARLRGRFPYNSTAVLSDGGRRGRPRKERIKSRAFRYRVETPSEHGGKKEIHLLAGHDYNRPLASVRAGTLDLQDTASSLNFDAIITPEIAQTQHGGDTLALIAAGLAVGISPGFRMPPERRVPVPEIIEDEGTDEEAGEFNAIIRTVLDALLYELSIVTRPAYPDTSLKLDENGKPIKPEEEARNWVVSTGAGLVLPKQRSIERWRR